MKKDLNYIAGLEKAISKKYGKEIAPVKTNKNATIVVRPIILITRFKVFI